MSPRLSIVVALPDPRADTRACLTTLPSTGEAVGGIEILLSGRGAERAPASTAGAPVRRVGSDATDVAAAWNRGADAAAGDILLFLRGDMVPGPGILPAFSLAHAGAAPVTGVGEVLPPPGSHPLASMRSPGEPDALEPPLYECAGQALSTTTALYRRAGRFTEGLVWGAEIDLAHRLGLAGAKLRRLPAPVGRLTRPVTAGDAVKTRLAAGRGSVALYRRTPALLPHLELGIFHGAHSPALRLRRLLLAAGGPPVPARLERLLPGIRWRDRWLRFQHGYHFWRGVRGALGTGAEWDALLRPPVILMYHAIGRSGERPGCYIVPARGFQRQLAWLRLRRYRVLALDELLAHRRAHTLPPARSVVITFDDGYADNHELAMPELLERGYTATFFLVSQCLGLRNTWDMAGELAARPMLTHEAVRAMRRAGMEIGAHTRTHPALPDLPRDVAAGQILGARHDLETTLGEPVRTFAYPYGRLDEGTVALVAEAGFEAACCSRSGVNDPAVPSHLLRRLEVRGTDSLPRFVMAVHRGWTRRRPRR